MTERHSGYLVVLDQDLREEDADRVILAIQMIRGVLTVDAVRSDLLAEQIATTRRDAQWQAELIELIKRAP